MALLANIIVAFVPVLVFLGVLVVMDSFKLVKISSVLTTIAAGATVALVCLPFHEWLLDWSTLDLTAFMRYVAPATEEALKASNKAYEAHIYPDVNHGFHNDSTPRYDKQAAELAWGRTIEFFKRHLG